MKLWIVACICVGAGVYSAPTQHKKSECELKCHSSFTEKEREQLCRGTHKGNLLGPALCAAELKSKASLKFDAILKICKGATSIQPAACFQALSTTDRSKYGGDLCAGVTSDLVARCWKDLIGYTSANKIKDMDILFYCRNLEDEAPLQCIRAAVTATLITAPQAMEPCKNASLDSEGATITPHCIATMRQLVNPTKGFKPVDIINFCAKAGTNGSIACFEAAAASLNTSPLTITQGDRARLCENAPGRGPVDCALQTVKLELRLRPEAIISLCSGADGIEPALCYRDGRGMGTDTSRIQLCNGAINSGPAHCFRRAQSVFRNDDNRQLLLCVGAVSEDPANCAYSAPHYLSADEKIDLCKDSPASRGQEPVKCLQTVEGPSHHFSKAPSKGLGYFLNTITLRADRQSRDLLISMCSFGSSSSPLMAAECIKASSFALDHDDAVRMCTNATSVETSRQMSICTKLLPRDWLSAESSILCDSVQSQSDAEGVAKCALETMHKLGLSRSTVATLCRLDTKKNIVLQCSLAAVPYPGPSTGVNSATGIPEKLLIEVCSEATTIEPGTCLAKVFGHGHMQFQEGAAVKLCKAKDAMSKLGCLQNLRKQYITLHDVGSCVGESRVVSGVKVIHFMSEDYKQEATAGKMFSLHFQLFDQWNQKLEFSSIEEERTLSASINDNNPQGAVLWGIRSNVTHRGVLELNRLMISQPGKVSFKLAGSRGADSIAVFSLNVKEDPTTRNTAFCVSFFRSLSCPGDMHEEDWVSYFPRTKGYIESSRFYEVFSCAETLNKWHVGVFPNPSGLIWLDYRAGIESIWTGINLPRMEMSFEQRLEIGSTGAKLKDIRRAYYRKSLQWHPDRWAAMPIYTLVVQGAFELIHEAYEGLVTGLEKNKTSVAENQ